MVDILLIALDFSPFVKYVCITIGLRFNIEVLVVLYRDTVCYQLNSPRRLQTRKRKEILSQSS